MNTPLVALTKNRCGLSAGRKMKFMQTLGKFIIILCKEVDCSPTANRFPANTCIYRRLKKGLLGEVRSPCSIKETMQGLLTHTVCACMQQGQNLPQIHIPEVKTATHIPDLVVNFSNTSTFWNSVLMPYFIKIKDIK